MSQGKVCEDSINEEYKSYGLDLKESVKIVTLLEDLYDGKTLKCLKPYFDIVFAYNT